MLSVVLILLFVDRFVLSWERMQLLGLWWARGQSEWVDSQGLKAAQENKPYLLQILETPEENPTSAQAALYFAAQMPNDPMVVERLTILANTSSDSRLQCQAQTLLARKFEVTIYSADEPTPLVPKFVGVNDFACQQK